ncbi:MAG: methyltransferase [Bdellovibrionales bacterium]|nr:methyltransferase [Bdellovibrionales bacterium]
MKYGAQPTNLLEWIALKTSSIPVPVLDTILPLIQARSLMAANNHGVFRELANRASTAQALAEALKLDEECLGLVLRVLQSMGYVSQESQVWSLSPLGRRHFGPQATESYEAFVEYGPPQWRFIENLDQVLETGHGIDFHDNQSKEEWDSYQRGMLENAKTFAWFIIENTPVLPGATSCLDIAGSHGYVGAALCQKYPPLRSTVLDRAEALATARALGEKEPWHTLVQFKEGNLLTDNFGRDHDVILLSNILHHFPAETNLQILKKVKAALKPGGSVSIFEIETPKDDQKPEVAGDGFALYFKITSTSSCFRGADYVNWLAQAGFSSTKIVRSFKMPSRMLVTAQR